MTTPAVEQASAANREAFVDAAPLVVFDFDLTLNRRDTADRFFRWLLRRQWWRGALVIGALPALLPMSLPRVTRKAPVRYAVWVATLGCSTRDLCRRVDEHANELFEAGEQVFLQDGLRRLRLHIDRGDRVVIATGCPEVLALALLARAGVHDVAMVGSSLKGHWGGLASHEHCFGARKVTMLPARLFRAVGCHVHHHHCDLPILRLAQARFLVNPRPETAARVERELGATETLAWR